MIIIYFLNTDGFIYWTDKTNDTNKQEKFYSTKNSADLEITSYVLLSKLHDLKIKNMNDVIQIAKWINSQRNSLGGFYSTQVKINLIWSTHKFLIEFFFKK